MIIFSIVLLCTNCFALFTAVKKGNDMKNEVHAPSHNSAGIVAIVVILILLGAGLAGYFFYRKRNNHLSTNDSFENNLYFNSETVPGTSDTKDLVTNIEQNEHVAL